MSSQNDGRPPMDRRFVVVPALTFLVGLALGAVLVWVGTSGPGGGDEEAAPSGTPSASPAEPTRSPGDGVSGVGRTVPEECTRAADSALQLAEILQDAVRALGDLDARRLQELVDRMEGLDQQIRADLQACREATSS
jgi:hypothetical protein